MKNRSCVSQSGLTTSVRLADSNFNNKAGMMEMISGAKVFEKIIRRSLKKTTFIVEISSIITTRDSLNNELYNGPKVRDDLVQVVVSPDIANIFRLIQMQFCHQDFRSILWRPSRGMPVH